VSTATQVESQIVAAESNTTAVESVDVVSVFSAPDVQEAKKIVADAKSMNVIFFIIVFCLFVFFCK
jgi:S-methylmethionine-dependent homocysteine/selenocysteine methylase